MTASTTLFIKSIIGGPSDFGIGWIVLLVSALVTIALALVALYRWAVQRLGDKRTHLRLVAQLAIGMDIRNFESILGNPVFINSLDDSFSGYSEYVFSNRYFYTQAIINSGRQVVLFSITTRSNNFNPSFEPGGSGRSFTLGKTKFADVGANPEKTFAHHDHGGVGFYSEVYYFGRPGHYLNYAFSMNFNGAVTYDYLVGSFSEDLKEKASERFRENTPINTYTVINLDHHLDISLLVLGPRTGQVWNLNN